MEALFKGGLTFAILKLLGNQLNLIERLKSWDIGLAKTSAPCFRNFPERLSMPAASDWFKPFKIFKNFSKDVLENSKFKSLNLILS